MSHDEHVGDDDDGIAGETVTVLLDCLLLGRWKVLAGESGGVAGCRRRPGVYYRALVGFYDADVGDDEPDLSGQ